MGACYRMQLLTITSHDNTLHTYIHIFFTQYSDRRIHTTIRARVQRRTFNTIV